MTSTFSSSSYELTPPLLVSHSLLYFCCIQVLRANDDVFLRLGPLLRSLAARGGSVVGGGGGGMSAASGYPGGGGGGGGSGNPVRVQQRPRPTYAGHMLPAGFVKVLRPSHFDGGSGSHSGSHGNHGSSSSSSSSSSTSTSTSSSSRSSLPETLRAQLVDRDTYPGDSYPRFAQGNAYALSRDLAEAVAALALPTAPPRQKKRLFADDLMVGVEVAALLAGAGRRGRGGGGRRGGRRGGRAAKLRGEQEQEQEEVQEAEEQEEEKEEGEVAGEEDLHGAYVHWKVDISFNVKRTPCSHDAEHHFNVDAAGMDALWDNAQAGRPQCDGIDTLAPFRRAAPSRGGEDFE